jgi:uncharacterized membrane protein YkoI
MNLKLKKIMIPALAATILAGGGLSIANASGVQDKPTQAQEVNGGKNQAGLIKQAKITETEATKIALEKVPGTVKAVELEDENGTIVYGFEIVAKDGSQQEVKIDAQTGKVAKVEADHEEKKGEERDSEENDVQNQVELAKQAKITETEATKIVLEKVPGTVKAVELEDEDGTIVYSFEIIAKDGSQQEVKIDAQTGKVAKVEADHEEKKGNEKAHVENEVQNQAEKAK